MRLLIKNGRVIDPSSGLDETLDVLIADGKIVAVEPRIESADSPIIDASRLVVTPGFIDMHSHIREPGQEKKEDISSASRAAAKGGFTTICAMPNTNPVNDSRRVTEYIIAESRKRAIISILPIAAITKGLAGMELADMADLAASGAVAFSDDGRGVQNSRIMRQALDQAKRLNTLIIDHCEDSNLSQGGVMNESPTSSLWASRASRRSPRTQWSPGTSFWLKRPAPASISPTSAPEAPPDSSGKPREEISKSQRR